MIIRKDILLTKREFAGLTHTPIFSNLINNKYLVLIEQGDDFDSFMQWLRLNMTSVYYVEPTIEDGVQIVILYASTEYDANIIQKYKEIF